MKRHAAPLRRWILLGTPIVLAGQVLGRRGGIALFFWIAWGAAKTAPAYPYPRKSRLHTARLLLAYAGGVFFLKGLSALLPHALAQPGISALGVMAAAFFLNVPLKKMPSVALALFLLLIAGR